MLLSSILIAVSVSLTGIIGLVVPHLIRMQIGADHRWLLPASAVGGAVLLLIADTTARTVIAPSEMPVGLLTSLLGGPYFLWLILRQRG
ncbi:iron chelate uptake ABC transporter family permease subunit [Orbaceae bacterium ESL0721]|nr:iron chelate uptake ABC transporter family permease subunit [Orbaceae bacterium ESL0721]